MKLQVTVPLAVLLSVCTSAPILQPRLGIIASNSNEVLRMNGITLAGVGMGQAQTQPEILLPPQFLNFGPQLPGPFLPPQQNQMPPVFLPPNQQEQQAALNPNNPPLNQNPVQVVPQFYPFAQGSGGQAFPYYLTYGFPPRNPLVPPPRNPLLPPNQRTASQNSVRPTPAPPQPVQNNLKVSEPWRLTPPPVNRGDHPGVDGAISGMSVHIIAFQARILLSPFLSHRLQWKRGSTFSSNSTKDLQLSEV
ncbi:hypothetical protein AOLI_G00191700 [Acnodon oligacanthus]